LNARATLAFALLATLGACAAPPKKGAPITPISASSTPRRTLRRASGEVHVRLAQLAGAKTLEVRDAAKACVKIERAGTALLCDGVRQTEARFAERGPWSVNGRRYRGSLVVRAASGASGFEVTNALDLEDYIAGVVASELVLWSASLETLRAQAIAARSYAVSALDDRGARRTDPFLYSDTRDMAYAGAFVPKNERERELDAELARAIESTRGRVLLEGERVVDARFHAACGGHTADARDVSPEARFECLRSVPCPACRNELGLGRESAGEPWSFTAQRAALDALAQRFRVGTRLERLRPVALDSGGRWLEVELVGPSGSARVRFEELRRALGADKLLSSAIELTVPRAGDELASTLRFEGRGRGHGVGLCQAAARECASAGWNAERILAHYYPGARVVDWR